MLWDIHRDKVDAQLADDADTIPGSFAAVQGFRSPTTQNGLWQEGRDANGNIVDQDAVVTYAKEFQSPHTVTNPLATEDGTPAAEAIDFARVDEHGNRLYDYKHPDWAAFRSYVDAHPRMHGGWHFPDPDPDHVQSTKWYATRQAIIAAGKW